MQRLIAKMALPGIWMCAALAIFVTSPLSASASPVPALTGISPTSAMATGTGFALLVNGSNFQGSCKLLWNGSPISCNFVSSTQLQGYVNSALIASAGQATVAVESYSGTVSNTAAFTIVPAPKLAAIQPSSTEAGANAFTLTVTGTNFDSTTQITWRGQPVATSFVSASEMTATIAASLIGSQGSFQVGVLEPNGISGGSAAFTVSPRAVPQFLAPGAILAASPAFTLTVNGANFTSATKVTWNGTPIPTTVVSSSELQAAIAAPAIASAGTANVGTVDPDGSTGAALPFTIKPDPAIASLSPASATATVSGLYITVNGSNFVGGYQVTWNGNPISTTFVSPNQLSIYAAKTNLATAGAAAIRVVAASSVASNPASFPINAPATLSAISPSSVVEGSGNVSLTVTGTGFASGWTVQWNGVALATTFVSGTEMTAVVPSSDLATPGTFSVTCVSPDAVATSPLTFSVLVSAQSSSLWARKLVWAHCLPHQVYSITTGNGGLQYGNMYPLDLQDASCADSPALDVTLAQSDGIDGFDFDIFADGTSADPYLSAADANGSFLIAPCIDLSVLQALRETPLQMENAVVQAVEDYAADASTHPSAARDKDAYVVFTFHQGMPLINWKSAIQRIAQAGVKVSWVSDLESAFNDCSAFPTATVDSYINLFGAGYFWNGRYDAMFGQTASLYAAQGRNFADSLLAGADRTGARVYVDSLGTSRMRSAWNNLAAYPSNWMQLSTWNDYDELSSVNMTSDWNSTRWDLDSWYAAQFKGNPSPFSTARLYITTPKAVAMNQAAQAEAMVINATSAPVTAYIELVDGDGNALCSPVSSTIPADSTGAALVPVTLTAEPSGYYVRARAWEIDANGNVLAKVVGAPTIVYPNASPTNVRVDYYSIPASAALPGPVGLSLSTLSGKLSATIRCPSGDSALFADLIADTTQVSDTHDASPAPIAVPATQGMFYIARVIDQNKCVGYSNPIYIAR